MLRCSVNYTTAVEKLGALIIVLPFMSINVIFSLSCQFSNLLSICTFFPEPCIGSKSLN